MSRSTILHEALRINKAIGEFQLGVNSSGNASVIDRSLRMIAIKPSGIPFKDLTEKEIVLVDFQGKTESTFKYSVDTPTHLALYQKIPECGAIIHIHSPYATAFAITQKEIPVLSTLHADYFGKSIPCAPYSNHRNMDLANHLLTFKHDTVPAILHGRHGAWVFGKTPEEALKLALAIEEVAKTAILATIASFTYERMQPLDAQDAEQLHKQFKSYGQ